MASARSLACCFLFVLVVGPVCCSALALKQNKGEHAVRGHTTVSAVSSAPSQRGLSSAPSQGGLQHNGAPMKSSGSLSNKAAKTLSSASSSANKQVALVETQLKGKYAPALIQNQQQNQLNDQYAPALIQNQQQKKFIGSILKGAAKLAVGAVKTVGSVAATAVKTVAKVAAPVAAAVGIGGAAALGAGALAAGGLGSAARGITGGIANALGGAVGIRTGWNGAASLITDGDTGCCFCQYLVQRAMIAMMDGAPSSGVTPYGFSFAERSEFLIRKNTTAHAHSHLQKSEQTNKQASTKQASTKQANTKLANTKLANTKLANTKQASTKQANTKQANTKQASKPATTLPASKPAQKQQEKKQEKQLKKSEKVPAVTVAVELFPNMPYGRRYIAPDMFGARPTDRRYDPYQEVLPDGQQEAERAQQQYLGSVAYHEIYNLCTTRTPVSFRPYCQKFMQVFNKVVQSIHHGDRPEEVCMIIDQCGSFSYVANQPHATFRSA